MNKALKLAAAGAAGALLGACTLGPDFSRPEAPAAGYLKQGTQGVAYGAGLADDWYRLFHSEALNALVRQALANNPDLEAAQHGLLAAQYELKAVSGAQLPQITANGSVKRGSINGSFLYQPPSAFAATGNQFSLGPALSYKLDLFGGVRRGVEAQAAATSYARNQALNTYITLVNQVVVTAFDYAASKAQVEVTQALVTELRSQYELTQKLEDAGKISRSDTLQAQTQLESTAATLPALEQQRDAYLNALARLSGKSPDEFAAPALSLKDFSLPAQLPVSLPSTLVRQRPDILMVEANLHQASAQIGVAQAARFPGLNLSASYTQQAGKLNQLFTQPAGIWSVGLDATTPIFDAGTLAARHDEAKERFLQARANYRGAVVGAFVEVADALQALRHDGDSYAAHNRALQAAAASRDLALAQYRAGKFNELQVLTVEQQYQNAALSQVQADAQRFTDVAQLFRALGGGWWTAPQDPAAVPVAAGSARTTTVAARAVRQENTP